MELFDKTVNDFLSLTNITESFIVAIQLGSQYLSDSEAVSAEFWKV